VTVVSGYLLVSNLILVVPILLLNAALAIEVLMGVRPLSPVRHETSGRTTLIMPAHNEAAIIQDTLRAVLRELPAGMNLLLVADNCEDETAALAESLGVRVLRRVDERRRGKGFALACARDHLRGDPPDAVIVLDADCITDRQSLVTLAGAALASERPAQAVNLLRADLAAHPLVQVSTFAFLLKNLIRQRGLQRLSGGVHLNGTGMAFPWRAFRDAELATSDVVEDLGLGLALAAAGDRPLFLQNAQVWSSPSTLEGTERQRTRWEGGFLATALRSGIPLLMGSLSRANWGMAWLGISLLIPPLALLALINSAGIVLSAAFLISGGSSIPLVLLAFSLGVALVAIALGWQREGRGYMSPRAILSLPAYFVWKLPMYVLLALRGSPRIWLRSGR
jgi:cellulose synthase/poly-beta-1,6-N-acetylglucosamine synthase-like glycosyltransferase